MFMTPGAIPAGLLLILRELPRESEWVEFKKDGGDPEIIGEYASALANGAALVGKPFGFLLWGIDDASREIVGTRFDPDQRVKGNQGLTTGCRPSWCRRWCFGFSNTTQMVCESWPSKSLLLSRRR